MNRVGTVKALIFRHLRKPVNSVSMKSGRGFPGGSHRSAFSLKPDARSAFSFIECIFALFILALVGMVLSSTLITLLRLEETHTSLQQARWTIQTASSEIILESFTENAFREQFPHWEVKRTTLEVDTQRLYTFTLANGRVPDITLFRQTLIK